MGLKPFKDKIGSGGTRSYKGVRVYLEQVILTRPMNEEMGMPKSVKIQIDSDENLIALQPLDKKAGLVEGEFRVSTHKKTLSGVVSARVSKYIPQGRYILKEKAGSMYLFKFKVPNKNTNGNG